MEILLQLVFSGIALGMIYAVIAFGYQLTFATSGTLNFGQGESLMLGALVGLSLVGTIHGGPFVNYWLMIPIVLVFGALQGMFVEWIGVRPAIKIKSEFGWIMSTIALAIIFKNVAENIWGKDDLTFPSPLSSAPIEILGANVQPMQIAVVVGALAIMAAVEIFRNQRIVRRFQTVLHGQVERGRGFTAAADANQNHVRARQVAVALAIVMGQ